MGSVGFGTYRVSNKSKLHKQALVTALNSGCKYIDTSSNYTNGESELLIGEVLRENPNVKPEIITKGGYIQGQNLNRLSDLNLAQKATKDIVHISEFLKHSIHPEFLEDQIELSLERLGVSKIDCYLLHNPEYYFQSPGASADEFYNRIKLAFEFLEEAVHKGKIKQYGISSNNFILPTTHQHVVNLHEIKKISDSISSNGHFKYIQFPFNLLEVGALEKLGEYGEESLLEVAQSFKLKTMINRPLNAFSNGQLLRLATYDLEIAQIDEGKDNEHFQMCLKLIENKWREVQENNEELGSEDIYQVPLINQFVEIWNKLPTPDAVDQVYHGYIFPFIARVWGESGLTVKESQPFYKLFELSVLYSKKMMTDKAKSFQKQAADVGLIPISNQHSFAVDVVESYLNYGFDIALVGMRLPTYVNEFKHLF